MASIKDFFNGSEIPPRTVFVLNENGAERISESYNKMNEFAPGDELVYCCVRIRDEAEDIHWLNWPKFDGLYFAGTDVRGSSDDWFREYRTPGTERK